MTQTIDELVNADPNWRAFLAASTEAEQMRLADRLRHTYKIAPYDEDMSPIDIVSAYGSLAHLNCLLRRNPEPFNYTKRIYGLREAASNGHLTVVNRLLEFPEVKAKVAADNNVALAEAARKGHLSVVNRLLELPEVKAKLSVEHNFALRRAAMGGHLVVVNRLLEFPAVQAKVAANNNIALAEAARKGHLSVVNRLLEFPAVQAAVAVTRNYVLGLAARESHLTVVNVFLKYPNVFSHAESHEQEYGQYVTPFIENYLTALQARKTALEANNPNAVFNIDNSEEATLCFYMIRNIIRRNSPALLDQLRILLDIPSVKALVHTAVTSGMPNELVRLALTIGNVGAAEQLMAIHDVRVLAEANQFYQQEAQGRMDLRVMAYDRESSMRSLSTGEQKRLSSALARYKPIIDDKKVENIFANLYETLQGLYLSKPGMIMKDNGKRVTLPLTHADFQRLALTPSERERALIVYYQNPSHTALRYLTKPNAWMATNASYVEIDRATGERWSTFEEYKPLISMFWLATCDIGIEPTDGYTFATRIEHFIEEVALIGRAHNWDKSRPRRDRPEEMEFYDDLKGDKPSCYSGVKRRLFQSVQGHPVLKMLTKEDIEQEIREFVRSEFKNCILPENRKTLREAYDNYILELNNEAALPLKALDISKERQQAFIVTLGQKYDDQFRDDPTFKGFIENVFKQLNREEPQHYHAIKFAGLSGLEGLLEDPSARSSLQAVSMHGARAAVAGRVSEAGKQQDEKRPQAGK